MNVFDRKAKRWHKNRAAMAPNADTFDYLRDEVREKKERKERIVTIWWLTTFTKFNTSAWMTHVLESVRKLISYSYRFFR